MKKPTLYATLRVPRVWNRLVQVEFKDGDDPPKCRGNTDPDDRKVYRDDCRGLAATLPNGLVFWLFLNSGRSNYYGCVNVTDPEGYEVYNMEECLEDFGSWNPIEFELGEVNVSVKLKFYGRR